MSDERNEKDAQPVCDANSEAALICEPNPKHSEPWQIGKRGSLCEQPRQLEIMLGRRDLFAVKVALLPDPDAGRAATREHAASWGSLEIWVNGHNLCAHIELGEPIDSVHWYLLPFLQWLASNWDFLLHEERLPKNAGPTAWTSMRRTNEAPPTLPADEAERWEMRWHQWWGRHCLVACREGGLLPNLFIRRWRDAIEFSWGVHCLAGAPEHFRFDAFPGCGRLAPDEVAYVLFGVLDRASRHLPGKRCSEHWEPDWWSRNRARLPWCSDRFPRPSNRRMDSCSPKNLCSRSRLMVSPRRVIVGHRSPVPGSGHHGARCAS